MNFKSKFVRSILGLAAVAILAIGCGPNNPPPTSTFTPIPPANEAIATPTLQPGGNTDALAGSKWQPTSINGATLVNASAQPKPVTLEFGMAGEVNGWGGCNSYGGTYQTQADTLTFSPLISTKMACVDEGLMQQETQYFQILQNASHYSLAPEQLTVTGQGQDTLVFTNASVP